MEKTEVVSQEIEKDKLFERSDGTFVYLKLKEEVRDWVKILANLSPIITFIIAYILKGRKKK